MSDTYSMTSLRQPAPRQPGNAIDIQRQLVANVVRLQYQVDTLATVDLSYLPLTSALRVWLAILRMSAHHRMPYRILKHDLALSKQLLAELKDWRIATERITPHAN